MNDTIQRVTIIGTGVIGASWAALFLAKGLQVVATDVAPGAETRLRHFIEGVWPSFDKADLADGASPANLRFSADLDEALSGADLVQENGPERLDFKRELYARLDERLPPEVIIASSSSGLKISDVQSACRRHPERCVTGHPFNPPHLIPLVEIVGGHQTSERTIARVTAFYQGIGKRTIVLHKEVPGHVVNRLQAALYREIVHLIAEGVVDVADADTAVSWGPGLRWGVMGPNLLYHLGGGAGGIEHFFEQFTGPMTAWWQDLGSPTLTPELQARIVQGVQALVDGRTSDALAERRDALLRQLITSRRGE